MNVVRQYNRDVQVACKLYQFRGDAFLVFKSMVLYFDVIMVGSEKFLVFACGFISPFLIAEKKRLGNLSLNACRKTDQSFMITLEKFKADSGLFEYSARV